MLRLFSIIGIALFVFTSANATAVTFGRDKLKGTTKTQGDFNLGHRVFFPSFPQIGTAFHFVEEGRNP
jgi:hypothetical protein